MISPLRYPLWETSISSANVSDARQTDRVNQLPKLRHEEPFAWFWKRARLIWPTEGELFLDFCRSGRVFVFVNEIVFVRQHFSFDFNLEESDCSPASKRLKMKSRQFKFPHSKTLNLSVSPSPGQLPPVEQRPVFRSHHGGIGVWHRRGQHHRDRLWRRQPDSQRHQDGAEEGYHHHQRRHPPHQTGPHPWRRWACKGRRSNFMMLSNKQ